jgi:hypothetical protein
VSNATSGGSAQQVLHLAELGAIAPLCALLRVADVKVVTVSLEGLENILRAALQSGDAVFNRITNKFADCGGLTLIEELQVCLRTRVSSECFLMLFYRCISTAGFTIVQSRYWSITSELKKRQMRLPWRLP